VSVKNNDGVDDSVSSAITGTVNAILSLPACALSHRYET